MDKTRRMRTTKFKFKGKKSIDDLEQDGSARYWKILKRKEPAKDKNMKKKK